MTEPVSPASPAPSIATIVEWFDEILVQYHARQSMADGAPMVSGVDPTKVAERARALLANEAVPRVAYEEIRLLMVSGLVYKWQVFGDGPNTVDLRLIIAGRIGTALWTLITTHTLPMGWHVAL